MKKWKQILKKHRIKIVLAGLAGIIVIIALVWNLWYNRDMPYKSLEIDGENVNCIMVVHKAHGYPKWTVTDKEQISEIMDYFNGLEIRELNPRENSGKWDALMNGLMNCNKHYMGGEIKYFTLTFYSDAERSEQNKLYCISTYRSNRISIDDKPYVAKTTETSVYQKMCEIFSS